MKTGRYRVRPGFRGVAVLQEEYNCPSFIAGQVDSSVRELVWFDVKFRELDAIQFRPADSKPLLMYRISTQHNTKGRV